MSGAGSITNKLAAEVVTGHLGAADRRFCFFLLSCRKYEADWRAPLLDPLREQAACYHIRLGRNIILTDTQSAQACTHSLFALPRFIRDMRRKARNGQIPVYLVSMATALPVLVVALRLALMPGIWLFDVYDDFSVYWGPWVQRLKGHIVNLLFYHIMTATIVAPPNLKAKFPHAYCLDMASDVRPSQRPSFDRKKLIISSNLDGRLDYDFIRNVALRLPQCEVHIYGQPHDFAPLTELLSSTNNVKYCGKYERKDFEDILTQYSVALAPFRANVAFTRSTDPQRYYDYLNAGLEVISTDIPRARDRADVLHIAKDAEEAASTYLGLLSNAELRKAQRWNWMVHSWRHRSAQFLNIIEKVAAQKFAHLAQKSDNPDA